MINFFNRRCARIGLVLLVLFSLISLAPARRLNTLLPEPLSFPTVSSNIYSMRGYHVLAGGYNGPQTMTDRILTFTADNFTGEVTVATMDYLRSPLVHMACSSYGNTVRYSPTVSPPLRILIDLHSGPPTSIVLL